MTACPLCQAVESARRAQHPDFIADLQESVVVLGENQGCRGWCVLLLKEHRDHLADLPAPRQARLFEEVARVAAAVRAVVGPVRINYECLGNQVSHVHWHVIPRHADDPTPRQPVWGWSQGQLRGALTEQSKSDLRDAIRRALA